MSRPGGKKRGVKSKHHGRKKPMLSKPFPRELTKPVTAPAVDRHTTLEDANTLWFAWLRVLANVRQMDLAPRHKPKS